MRVKLEIVHLPRYVFVIRIYWHSFFWLLPYPSIIPSNITTESLIMLSKCLPFSQVHVIGFQIYIFFAQMLFSWIFVLTSTFIDIPFLV